MSANRLELLTPPTNLPHDSAHLHVAGTSTYVDDKPKAVHELHVGVVHSPHAKARIVSIEYNLPDDCVVLTARDLHHNLWGGIFLDQPLIAEHSVNHVGEVVAVVAASSSSDLKAALKQIVVTYEVGNAILSIDEACAQKSFIGDERAITRGDVDQEFARAPHRLSGSFDLQGADHFYLENQSVLAHPEDDGRITVYSSTQHPTETQTMVAEALGVPLSFVVCIAERLGGGFGGKETQAAPFAVYAALVAHKTKRPARLVLSKDDDMIITGKRNPFRVSFDVGFDERGVIMAFDAHFVGNAGAYADLSPAILERAMAHVDNAYYLPHARIRGRVVRTNYHSHTAFRGFGGPKGVALIEHVMEAVAHFLNVDALDVRLRNCYQGERNVTPYGQVVENNLLPGLFTTLAENCDYRARRKALDAWNQNPRNNPRGISMTGIKFGICFTARFYNQGHALVHVFRDGSVQVATGAVEMGQGVQVRIKGVVADAFGISPDEVRILATATDKSANTSPTAASSGTDLNATAALDACNQIKDRLARLFYKLADVSPEHWPDKTAAFGTSPEIELSDLPCAHALFVDGTVKIPGLTHQPIAFKDLVNAAYLSRFALSAYGFYRVPGVSFNKITGEGTPFLYFTQGVACSEVELDRYTGYVKCLRTDILMDAGNPINYAMDKGQIAGAFIQGLGWVTTENLFYDAQGKLLSHSPSTYKIPSIHDIPRIFNIDLVKNVGNEKNIYGTKATGEPPLMLCFSVWNAIKNALASQQSRAHALPLLPVPATAEIVHRFLSQRKEK